MKERTYLLNILLAIIVGIACLAAVLAEAFFPAVVVPHIGLPHMALVVIIPLIVEQYVGAPKKRDWIGSTVLAGLTFAVLPVCAGMTGDRPVWLLFVCGAAVFAVTTVLYSSMGRRMASGPKARLAPAVNGLLLFLAVQFFQGIL